MPPRLTDGWLRMQHFMQHYTTFLQKLVQQSITKLHWVAKRIQHPGKQKKCIVQHFFSEKF